MLKRISPQGNQKSELFVSNDWGRINLDSVKSNIRTSREKESGLEYKKRASKPELMQSINLAHQRSPTSRSSLSKKAANPDIIDKGQTKHIREKEIGISTGSQWVGQHSLTLLSMLQKDLKMQNQSRGGKKSGSGLGRAWLKKPPSKVPLN